MKDTTTDTFKHGIANPLFAIQGYVPLKISKRCQN